MATTGERIQRARLARQMSGEDLARAVGYRQQSAIGNLENRGGGTGGKKLPEIARVLRVPLIWLMEGPDDGDIPFTEAPVAEAPGGATPKAAKENDAGYTVDASLLEAVDMFKRLRTEQRLRTINFMRDLLSQGGTDTNQTRPGERDPIPLDKAA